MFKEVRIKNKPNLSFKLRSYLFMALSVFDSSQQILQIKEYKVWFKKHDIGYVEADCTINRSHAGATFMVPSPGFRERG